MQGRTYTEKLDRLTARFLNASFWSVRGITDIGSFVMEKKLSVAGRKEYPHFHLRCGGSATNALSSLVRSCCGILSEERDKGKRVPPTFELLPSHIETGLNSGYLRGN